MHSIHIIKLRLISKLREYSFDLNIEKTISSTNVYKLAQRSKWYSTLINSTEQGLKRFSTLKKKKASISKIITIYSVLEQAVHRRWMMSVLFFPFFCCFFFLTEHGKYFISKFYWQSKVGHYWKQNTHSWSILMNRQLLACSLSETNGERKESTEDSLSRDLTWTFQSLRDFQDSHRNPHRKMLHFLTENQRNGNTEEHPKRIEW